ncbi:hypothetical protein [uncultured Jatrophihabitans sp.]|uniref:hypothetical protein n=1 Tax=uncultured Jatrophihabitans sp. TaxID=1610747 RepID=UPI0035C9B448
MSPRRPARPSVIEVQPVRQTLGTDRVEIIAEMGDYIIRGVLRDDGDRYRLVEFGMSAVEFTAPEVEITSTALRQVELAKFADAGRQIVVMHGEHDLGRDTDDRGQPTDVAAARRRIKAASRSSRSGGSDRGDAFYRRVALDLIELVESGRPTPGGVLETLADVEAKRLGHEVPVQTLRTWIRLARERKFLAPSTRGRMSAEPGARLYRGDE